jgi:hypothetical protein
MVSCGDRLGKMPKSKSGNSNILSLVDYFTKWPEAIAIPDKKAKQSHHPYTNFFSQWAFQQFTAVIKAESLSIQLCHR